MENNIKIENNKILYEEDGIIFGYIEFIYLDDNTVDIIHTFVDPNHRVKGIAKKLVEYAFSYFEEKDINVIYSCSYVQKYKEK